MSADMPAEPGSLVVLTTKTPEGGGWTPRSEGSEFVVEEFCPALQPGDDGYGDEDTLQGDFYYGSDRGGCNNVCVPADIVRRIKSAEEMAAREIPDLRAASRLVSDGLISTFGEGAEMFETSVSGADDAPVVEAYGRTDDGLGFGMEVAVLEVWRTDD